MFGIDGLWLVVGVVVLLIVVMGFFLARRSRPSIEESWGAVAQALGLYFDPSITEPRIMGDINGVNVLVDIHRMPSVDGTPQPPWTRVRAQMAEMPQVHVRHRGQAMADPDNWDEYETEDADFDKRYEVHMAPDADPKDALPPRALEVMKEVATPCHIMNDVVLWTHERVVLESGKLIDATRSAAEIAAAFRRDD